MSSKCKQCGQCCLTVGRTFWKNGDYEDIPELNEKANDGEYEDAGLPCEMFEFQGQLGICLIHERYGYKAKPKVCRWYPEDGEICFRQKEELLVKAAARLDAAKENGLG